MYVDLDGRGAEMTEFPSMTDEQRQLRDTVKQFALDELYPHREEWDRAGEFPREVFKKLADLGVLGIRFGEEYGGLGLNWGYTAAYVEGLAHCRNSGVLMSVLVDTDMATPIIDEIGTDEQKRDFLAPVISGDYVASLGVSEPGAGSDVASLRTTARKDGDDYVINGQKTWITNASFADVITLAVRTGEAGHGGISLVLFPTDTKGFSVGRKLDKLGTRSVSSCENPLRGLSNSAAQPARAGERGLLLHHDQLPGRTTGRGHDGKSRHGAVAARCPSVWHRA